MGFPRLTSNMNKRSELTVYRHCANKFKRRKSVGEENLVVVNDKFKKDIYDVIMSEVVGTNNYIVECNNGLKYVSGDNLSVRSSTTPKSTAEAEAPATDENLENNSTLDDDNLSTLSDDYNKLKLPDVYLNNYNNV